MKRLLLILVLSTQLWAVNRTVKAGGGGDFTTIQACSNAMAAGDTCTVYAGTYAENVTVTAGTSGNQKTFTINTGDTVNVLSFTVNSYVSINGFNIKNTSAPTNAPCVSIASNSTSIYITNNVMSSCNLFVSEPSTGSNVSHVFIQGNTMSYSCSTAAAPNTCTAMHINGDYHLIENNDISHVSDGPYINGQYEVFRNNTFHDALESDCGSNSGNCHIDLFQADANVGGGSLPTKYFLIEGNTVTNMVGSNTHGSGLLQGEVCAGQCRNAIIRFNATAHVGGGGITNDNSQNTPAGANSPPWIFVKSYNNTWADMNNLNHGLGGGTNGFDHGSYGGSSVNEIHYFPFTLSDFNPYECQDGNAGTSLGACTGPPAFNAKNNLGFCTGSPCLLRPHTYGSGTWTSDPGNVQADPLFVNYAGNDFHLQAGSPAISAGSYLTTASGSGSSSTSLTVADASYFQDGFGITGVQADWIRIGTTTTVQISAVNYATNVITLASPATWANNDPIYLYRKSDSVQVLFGSNPDMGAFPASTLSGAKSSGFVQMQGGAIIR